MASILGSIINKPDLFIKTADAIFQHKQNQSVKQSVLIASICFYFSERIFFISAFFTLRANGSALLQPVCGGQPQLHKLRRAYPFVNNPAKINEKAQFSDKDTYLPFEV